jgi:L-arabinonolactonase
MISWMPHPNATVQFMTLIQTSLVGMIPVANTLGEGVLWDEVYQCLWWTDIHERRLYRYDPVRAIHDWFALPERLCSFGFVANSDRLISAFESGFAYYHPPSGKVDWLERPPHAAGCMRFNDGRVDRQGRFWAGSMVEGNGEPSGKLYCLNEGVAQVHLSRIKICNSVCFSPDGHYMYFADSPHRAILRFDIDVETGALSNQRLFAQTPTDAFPDGSNVDNEGHVWNAQWGAGRVVRYSPNGEVSGLIELPVSQPSCIAFGGAALDLLFVTTAREGLNATALATQPKAGDVFIYQTNVKGIPEARYRGSPTVLDGF